MSPQLLLISEKVQFEISPLRMDEIAKSVKSLVINSIFGLKCLFISLLIIGKSPARSTPLFRRAWLFCTYIHVCIHVVAWRLWQGARILEARIYHTFDISMWRTSIYSLGKKKGSPHTIQKITKIKILFVFVFFH